MMGTADEDYYARRAAQERARAARADDRSVGSIHAELADRYAQLAEATAPAKDGARA